MLNIFYRLNENIEMLQSNEDLKTLRLEDVVWIDLLSPTGDEKRAVEAFLGTEIQSRAQAEEIESSSRFSESDIAIFANTNYLTPAADGYTMDPVTFTVVGDTLTTLREIPLRSFTQLQRKIQAKPQQFSSGFVIFVSILDQRVDLDADIVEILSKETSLISKRINQKEDINEELLLDINQLQENAMLLRENVVDKQRLISNIVKSERYPEQLEGKLNVLLQDISSLINHTNFSFERLEYLQDTVVGLINLEQNNIMKIFTFISLMLMPATLVASFYGMNVHLPFEGFRFAWLLIAALMLVLIVGLWLVFKKRDMM